VEFYLGDSNLPRDKFLLGVIQAEGNAEQCELAWSFGRVLSYMSWENLHTLRKGGVGWCGVVLLIRLALA
jgi:hypothetical protein